MQLPLRFPHPSGMIAPLVLALQEGLGSPAIHMLMPGYAVHGSEVARSRGLRWQPTIEQPSAVSLRCSDELGFSTV